MNSFTAFGLLAASRTNPAIKELGMCVGLGLFVAAVSVALIYFGAKKRGKTMDGAFYQKLAMYGVVGLVCGYFAMRITIKNNPELFREGSTLSERQIQNINSNLSGGPREGDASNRDERIKEILRNPIPEQPEIELKVVDSLRKPLSSEEREERVRQAEAHRVEIDAIHKANGYDRLEDRKYLDSLSLSELERVLKERKLKKEDATKQLRELQQKDSGATPEERRAASMHFSTAVSACMEANKARVEKIRLQREANR